MVDNSIMGHWPFDFIIYIGHDKTDVLETYFNQSMNRRS